MFFSLEEKKGLRKEETEKVVFYQLLNLQEIKFNVLDFPLLLEISTLYKHFLDSVVSYRKIQNYFFAIVYICKN